jgi:hypothetical protein
MHSMPCRGVIRSVVVIVEIAVPLAPVLDGGAAVFS